MADVGSEPKCQRWPFTLAFALSGWLAAVAIWLHASRMPPPPAPLPLVPTVPAAEPLGKLDGIFRDWLANANLAGAAVAFCVLDEEGQTIFASPLAATALGPASALKTVTTGAALGLLGPEFRFETLLIASAPLATDGSLEGDLVLVGAGDPTLSRDDLAALADAAIASGLKSVSGRLVVDASVFPQQPVNDHWNWGDIGNAYGAGAFGVNVDHNRMRIRFGPGAQPGAPAKLLGGEPALRDLRWENHVVTGPAGSGDQVVVYSQPYIRTITLRGSVPADEPGFTITGAIPDPPALAAEFMQARLEKSGVKFSARPAPAAAAERTTLASHQSPPLAEIIDHLHRVSDNLEAQCLFLTIGRRQDADPAEVVRQYWEKAGVAFTGLRLLDGSGLARANMIRPLDLARVNFAARRGPHGQRFYESLTAYANGKVRGKLGAMSGVKTQVGFVRTAQDREFTFAIFGNGLGAGGDFWTRMAELLESVRTAEL